MASRDFNQRDQQPTEKVDEYASELKWLFKQAYLDKDQQCYCKDSNCSSVAFEKETR